MSLSYSVLPYNVPSFSTQSTIKNEVDSVFSVIVKHTDGEKLLDGLVNSLHTKRNSVHTDEEYIMLLGNEVAFFQILLNGTLEFMKELVDDKPKECSREKIKSELYSLKDRVKELVDQKEGRKFVELIKSQHGTKENVIAVLENDHTLFACKYNLLIDWLDKYTKHASLDELYKAEGAFVAELIKDSLDFYTKLINEKVRYGV